MFAGSLWCSQWYSLSSWQWCVADRSHWGDTRRPACVCGSLCSIQSCFMWITAISETCCSETGLCPHQLPCPPTKETVPSPDTLALGQLRTVLIADHLGGNNSEDKRCVLWLLWYWCTFCHQKDRLIKSFFIPFRYTVSFCPALPQDSDIVNFLKTTRYWLANSPCQLDQWGQGGEDEKRFRELNLRERETERGKRRSRGEEIEGERTGIRRKLDKP